MIHKRKRWNNVVTLPTTGLVPEAAFVTPPPKTNFWSSMDKILGIGERGADIYTQVKTGYDPNTPVGTATQVSLGREDVETGFLGLQKPWGAVIILSVGGLIVFALVKMNKK